MAGTAQLPDMLPPVPAAVHGKAFWGTKSHLVQGVILKARAFSSGPKDLARSLSR
jgi:hypothetical protein